MELLSIFTLWPRPAFQSRDITMYLRFCLSQLWCCVTWWLDPSVLHLAFRMIHWLGHGLDNQFPAGLTESYFVQNILTRSGAQPASYFVQNILTRSGAKPASYSMAARGSYPGSQAAGARGWPFTPSCDEVKNEWSCTSTPHKHSQCTPVQWYSLNKLLNTQM